ncbi:MAG: hypothetical protein IT377_09915 [Polyangiaceae bacterium]|nr:hypothetical protein [Polyangiaceae bacterium]
MPERVAPPLCIVGDVHLSEASPRSVSEALAGLVEAHSGYEIVLNGDTFDLSSDPADRPAAQSVTHILAAHPEAREALGQHVERGGRLSVLAGNHDAAVATPEVADTLRRALGQSVDVAPWFLRRGPVHIEHGHLYDPDNAPTHPLAPWSLATEPLGVALTRRFVSRAGVWDFAHGDETTPLDGLLKTFRLYGVRAPLKVLHYFATAAALTREAGRQAGVDEERAVGARAIAELARRTGVDADALHALALESRVATHHDRGATFQRLYLDRSLATLIVLGALGAAALGSTAGAGAAALGAGYLGWSISRGTNRYRGLLERRLDDAATRIRELTGARWVVFGHSHRVTEQSGALNPGSFAFPDGPRRRFVSVAAGGVAELRAI